MKIIYFTTALMKEDYVSFSSAWQSSLNTSIQNLHNRLIRTLGMTHEVEVISLRPFSRKYCQLKKLEAETRQEGKIRWHYIEIKRSKLPRYLTIASQCKKIVSKMDLKDCIILTDTLNPNVLRNSTQIAKKFNLPIIGVCNNTPSGIHDTGRSYTTYLLNQASDLSGYITLTPGLNELFNTNSRANMSFEGIVDDKCLPSNNKIEYGPYLYYNGSLEEKYGVYDLIKAFNLLNDPKLHLVISGYHASNERLNKAINGNANIHFLGMIQCEEAATYASQSLANINPRPYSEDYDRYLIPENLIDFFASKSLVISTKNRHFKKYFANDAIWIDSSDTDDLIKGIKDALNLSKAQREEMIKNANADVNKLYSMSMINRRTILFLKQFLKQKE